MTLVLNKASTVDLAVSLKFFFISFRTKLVFQLRSKVVKCQMRMCFLFKKSVKKKVYQIIIYRRVTNYTRSLDFSRPVTMVLSQSFASDFAASDGVQ